jgi:hypothetical protein
MDALPEFVKENEPDSPRRAARAQLTGWETVVFQVEDEEPGSVLSTAALAP